MSDIHEILQERFAPYCAEVNSIRRHIAEIDPDYRRELHAVPGYIDSGAEFDVVRLLTNRSVVAKLPYESPKDRGATVNEVMQGHIGAYATGLRVKGLEQIVAYNSTFPAILCRYVAGPLFTETTETFKRRIPLSYYAGVVATFKTMQSKGLQLDIGIGNIIVHPRQGFTIIDYKAGDQPMDEKVLHFASNQMLLGGTRRGGQVPEYALSFRDLCAREFGSEIVALVNRLWEEEGFIF